MKRALLGLAACLTTTPFWAATAAPAAPVAEFAALECARPSRRVDRILCGNPALAEADRTLAALAAELAQRLQNRPLLQTAQQDWAQRRNRMCAPSYAPECLTIAYAEREAWLRARLASLPEAPPSEAAPAAAAPPTADPATTAVPIPVPPLAGRPAAPTTPVPPPAQPTPATPLPLTSGVSAMAAPAAPQLALPDPAASPTPPPLGARPSTPAQLPAGGSFAAQLASAPCAMVSSNAVRAAGWANGQSPFGMPFQQWTQQDYSALSTRIRECQAENGESLRNVQLLQTYLGSFRNSAPPGPSRPLTPSSVPPAASPAATAPAGAPPTLDCADQALLTDVVFIFQSQPGADGQNNVQRLSNPRPYTDVIVEAYNASPALRDDYRRLQPYMAPVPQCLVNATTPQGDIVLSYRLYAEGGRTLVEVRRVP